MPIFTENSRSNSDFKGHMGPVISVIMRTRNDRSLLASGSSSLFCIFLKLRSLPDGRIFHRAAATAPRLRPLIGGTVNSFVRYHCTERLQTHYRHITEMYRHVTSIIHKKGILCMSISNVGASVVRFGVDATGHIQSLGGSARLKAGAF